ncbi:hypothetical protein PPEP_a4278 [Pseudoalteromonas peptidolytica F12-50-A1]|uniref:Uncharacterized protein n=1 Tax=Pseudoalteromonas peptidolytica F12-50-A1 TaxID=1315280 RepID=A0A8I0MXZ4_9GAMM|nr:hypothetical protein [Pseudoalteromonas peptidolytica F12-50-A1]
MVRFLVCLVAAIAQHEIMLNMFVSIENKEFVVQQFSL